jgi:hypothetical protein
MSFSESFKAVVEEWLTQQKDAVIPRSKEFNDSGITFYISAGRRWNHELGDVERAVSVVRVVVNEVSRGKGVFREFMKWMEDAASRISYQAVYVNQVHSEILQESLPRNGYVRDPSTDPLEHVYRKTVGTRKSEPESPVDVEDLNVYAISDVHAHRYITALVGPDIRTSTDIQKAMLTTGRQLAEAVRDSLRGPQSTRYAVVPVVMFDNEGKRK